MRSVKRIFVLIIMLFNFNLFAANSDLDVFDVSNRGSSIYYSKKEPSGCNSTLILRGGSSRIVFLYNGDCIDSKKEVNTSEIVKSFINIIRFIRLKMI